MLNSNDVLIDISNFDFFCDIYEKLKTLYSRTYGNIFLNINEIKNILTKKKCLMGFSGKSLFIFIPKYNIYDLLFITGEINSIPSDFEMLMNTCSPMCDVRISLIGYEKDAQQQEEIFKKANFTLKKKLLRMRLKKVDPKIIKIMHGFQEGFENNLGYAIPEDAEEINEILHSEFDVIGDNLPDIDEILECIHNKNIAIIRKDNRILSLQYFKIKSGTIHILYDITRSEYRGANGLFMAIASYVHEDLNKRGLKCQRALGWRDANNKKLVNYTKKSNEFPDGIVIYNMSWKPEKSINHSA